MTRFRRSLVLAAALVAASVTIATPSLARDRGRHFPLPPVPHLRPPVPPVPFIGSDSHMYRGYRDDRYRNDRYRNDRRDDRYRDRRYRQDRYRNDRYRYDRHRDDRYGSRWNGRSYDGLVWVPGHYNRWGRWIPGHWRSRY